MQASTCGQLSAAWPSTGVQRGAQQCSADRQGSARGLPTVVGTRQDFRSFSGLKPESFRQDCSPSPFRSDGCGCRRVGERLRQVQATLADAPKVERKGESKLQRGTDWAVHKFGGTCVANPERIQNVADIVVKDSAPKKVVVVSAMSKVTDMMYSLIQKAEKRNNEYLADLEAVHEKHRSTAETLLGAEELKSFLARLKEDIDNLRAMLRAIFIAGNATEAFADYVVGHGEIWSAQMLAATVRQKGVPCTWMDAREVLTVVPSKSGQNGASVSYAKSDAITQTQVDPLYDVSDDRLDVWYSKHGMDTIIATGFVASTPEGIPTTLKRDGSDFSSAIIGSLFRAGRITIWTDVNGVYSADPRKVSEAVVLSQLSYQEAWEMSYFGANVLHPRTTLPAMRYNIPITIRNIFNKEFPGTKIWRTADLQPGEAVPEGTSSSDSVVKGFATIDNICLINVEGTGLAGVPGTASSIFSTVSDVGANVVMISQASSEHSVCFAVPEKEATAVSQALEYKFKRALQAGRIAKVEVVRNCSILAAVGQRMASTPGVSATLFSALAKANINVRAIAQGCSEYNITVVVDGRDSVRALNAVHSRFYLSRTPIAVGVIGPGNIGATLLDQFGVQAMKLKEEFHIDLRVLGISGQNKMLLDDRGIDLAQWQEALQTDGQPADLDKFAQSIQSNYIPNRVIVDCTASAHVASYYEKWLTHGIHIVTPNKKLNSGPLEQYLAVRELQRKSYTHYFYEATVGAGLPIMSTLRGLLETGDKVERIEGIFSGTLSFIFNSYTGEKPFSSIVADAKASGYTEPDPRDDLSGMDVARKVTILARESGLPLELETIPVRSLVPKELEDLSVEEFMAKLPEYDRDLARQHEEAAVAGEVLRYVGVVDAVNGKGSVELRRYPKSHAFAQLSGTDNIISFQTTRYHDQPLIIRGPGAGREVTAGGVFSDILRLAAYLGAPS